MWRIFNCQIQLYIAKWAEPATGAVFWKLPSNISEVSRMPFSWAQNGELFLIKGNSYMFHWTTVTTATNNNEIIFELKYTHNVTLD